MTSPLCTAQGKQSSDWSARGNSGVWQAAAKSGFTAEKPLEPWGVWSSGVRSLRCMCLCLPLDVIREDVRCNDERFNWGKWSSVPVQFDILEQHRQGGKMKLENPRHQREQSTFFQSRTMTSDLVVPIFISATSQSTAPSHFGGPGSMRPTWPDQNHTQWEHLTYCRQCKLYRLKGVLPYQINFQFFFILHSGETALK